MNSAAYGCLALIFLLLFGGSCGEILPAAEEADLAPGVALAAARFTGELYGCEQNLALGVLGRMLIWQRRPPPWPGYNTVPVRWSRAA